jgi:putative DNA primase/helicase
MSDMNDLTPTTSSNTAAADPRSKALIWAGGGDPHRQANDARDALAAANTGSHPRVMVHGNALVRMNEDGGLENLSVNSLIDELSRIAQFQQGKDEPVDVSPPERVAKILLDRDPKDMAGMPRVRRVAETPVYVPGPDNRPRLVSTPGLDRESGVYYVPAPGLEDMLIPTGGIGVGEVEEALDAIENELFIDFGFESEADRANAIGLLLLPFVREIIDGPTPLFLARAPDAGSGKTLLVEAALFPGCGEVANEPDASGDEWKKRITSTLLAGRPVMFLDNLSGKLDSDAVANLITTETWGDRILGKNQSVSLPVRVVFAATGSNLTLSRQMARRAYASFLDPYANGHNRKPSERGRDEYRHAPLIPWARAHRAELVRAALVLIQHWAEGPAELTDGGWGFHRSGGDPRESAVSKGSFERWAAVIGGVLEQAGVPGFLGNSERLEAETDTETQEIAAFFAAWEESGQEMAKADVVRAVDPLGGWLRPHLPTELAGVRGPQLEERMAYWLRDHKNLRVGGYQLNYDKRSRLWSVRRVAA